MRKWFCKPVHSRSLHSALATLAFTLLLAAPTFAQGTGNSPWENAVARGLSLVAIVVAGLTFAFVP
jgi:hypothetical protein